MSWRARVVGLTALAMLALSVAAWAGLHSRPSVAERPPSAPLIRPRFVRSPALSLGVLVPGVLPPPLQRPWTRAASGSELALAKLRGMPIVVNFWASWCDPCRREAPLLERAWRAQRGRVLVLGVNQNDARDDALAFIRRFGLTYPSVREPGDTTAIRWGVGGLPVTFFIAADGRAVAQTIGQLRPGQLEGGIAAALKGRL